MHPLRHRPFLCPAGHDLTGGDAVLVGWEPCVCGPAQTNHNGHRTYQCLTCKDEGWTVVCRLPEHLPGAATAQQ